MPPEAEDEDVTRAFASVNPRPQEVTAPRPGDDIVTNADVVMDRAFTLEAPPEAVWPWVIQLGKQRAGWYLPRSVERFVPRRRRAARRLDVTWQSLVVGDVIPTTAAGTRRSRSPSSTHRRRWSTGRAEER